ncbi:MAG: PspC domain-containing protein [Bacteroidaceae bacterium]|nr:PspC domain-containing protein [Bacteroidaceae bacterium]
MKRLVRSANGKIAGVCAGVAEYFGWNVSNVRLVWLVCALLGLGAPLLFYIILSLVMPVESQKDSYEERMNKRLGK